MDEKADLENDRGFFWRTVGSSVLRHRRRSLLIVAIAFCVFMLRPSRPDGVDVTPITTLHFAAGPDFLARVQLQLQGRASDWSQHSVGTLVYRIPNADPSVGINRSVNIFRQESQEEAQAVYAHQKQVFTSSNAGDNWKLYREAGDVAEKWFISYQGLRMDTNHGMPVGIIAKPDIFIGILKQNVVIVITYTAFDPSWNYVRTINRDIQYVADILSGATM